MGKVNDVIECAVKNGSFGENLKLIDVVSSGMKGEDHFASAVVFAKVILKNDIDDLKSYDIVIKNQQDDPFHRDMMMTHVQFYNELVMYRHVLPYLGTDNKTAAMFPRFFHGVATLGKNFEDDIIILEDLRSSGFRLSKERIFLDIDHCKLALTKLGKFHAASYLAKRDDFDNFSTEVKKLKEVRNCNPDDDRFLSLSIERSIAPLDSEAEYKRSLGVLREKMKKPSELRQKLVEPSEPLAVLCHGDFCRNNFLFKYSADGRPEDVRFFDLGTSCYASPAVDLSFFMLMNTSTEMRSSHWCDLLSTYHGALVTAAAGCPVPSLEQLSRELRDKALYGYILCSFFIPMMVDGETATEEEVDFSKMTREEMDARCLTIGGEIATEYTSNIVKDLIKFECI